MVFGVSEYVPVLGMPCNAYGNIPQYLMEGWLGDDSMGQYVLSFKSCFDSGIYIYICGQLWSASWDHHLYIYWHISVVGKKLLAIAARGACHKMDTLQLKKKNNVFGSIVTPFPVQETKHNSQHTWVIFWVKPGAPPNHPLQTITS